MPAVVAGMDPALVRAAVSCAGERLARHGAAGQLVVRRQGQTVIDQTFGDVKPGGLFLTYSCSKAYTALVVHLLAEQGELSLDEPVARWWPEFGHHGKDAITARHVLTHRAGVPDDLAVRSLLTATDWDASVRRMELLRPEWPAGAVTAYHTLTYGWILGELAHRVTGVPFDELMRQVLLEPLGMRDTFMGLPDREGARAVPLVPAGGVAEMANALVFNLRRYRRAVAPAATISATAHDMARLFEMLRCGGSLDGVRVLAPGTILEARRPSASEPEFDRTLGRLVRWAHGFHLGGPPGTSFMGRLSTAETFGCTGVDCCTAWADPSRELVFVYLTNLLVPPPTGIAHHSLVADCILRACG